MLNVEIKAHSSREHHDIIRSLLIGDVFQGVDFQVDTYFNVNKGRLKLRESMFENFLIQYDRNNQTGPKVSNFLLTPITHPSLKQSLINSLGILAVVEKKREIYFRGNIKIHLDCVSHLGYFVEIEARNEPEIYTVEYLRQQCDELMNKFSIHPTSLITNSYSDMILKESL